MSPTGYHLIPFLHFIQEARNVIRIILQISIHHNDDLSPSLGEAGAHGCALPEVLPEDNYPHSAVSPLQFPEPFQAFIRAAIIHEEDLMGLFQPCQSLLKLAVKGKNILLLVVDGKNDG